MFQLESITENQFKSNYVCLDKKIKLMTIEGDSVCLEQIVRGKDKFAIRFNDAGCSSCIEDFRNHISQIQQLIENLGSDNVILFLNTRNPRDLSVFKKQYDLKCNIFALEAGALPTQMEAGDEIVTYYYFIINQNYAVTECFVSIKELVERTQWYFDSIIRKFKYQTVRIVD